MGARNKLSKAQAAMLQKALAQGFVLAPAGVQTAWILVRAGLLKQGKRWTKTRCTPGMVHETYLYQMELTDQGRAAAESAKGGGSNG